MKLSIISAALSLAITSSAFAGEPINVVLPGSPGGNMSNIVNLIEPYLAKKGWTLNVTTTGNCANANYIYKNSASPVVTVWLNYDNMSGEDHPCHMPTPSEDSFITTLYQSPEFICRLPDQVPLLETKEGETVTLSAQDIQIRSKRVIPTLEAATKADIKVVRYSGSGGQSKGMAAKETQYIIGTIGASLAKNGTVVCDYNTGLSDVAGTVPLSTALGGPQKVEMYMISYMVSANMDSAAAARFRSDVQESLQQPEVKKYFTERDYETAISVKPVSEQINTLINNQ